MKKRILCFIVAALMLLTALPISVFASNVIKTTKKPIVSVSSLYKYNKETDPKEFRALPDSEGVFYFEISLDHAPTDNSDVVVYYRTVDDSAVAKWGDYESVAVDAFVTLSSSNGYKASVKVESQILDNGFYTDDASGNPDKDKIISRRFIFELISVESGKADLSESNSSLYCYLRASSYVYQDDTAGIYSPLKDSVYEVTYDSLEEVKRKYGEDSFIYLMASEQILAHMKVFEENIKYYSLYQTVDGASALSTPPLQNGKQTSHSDSINLKFDEEWQSYVQSGWCDLGISIYGTITREYWDSNGDTEFNLYYYYGGEKKLALTLYLEGEFDDSTFFGWEHAFEYAIEGQEDGKRDDHIDDNFIGFTVYDNDGNVAYKVKKDGTVVDVCSQLNKTLIDGNTVIQARGDMLTANLSSFNTSAIDYVYYLRLPSNFALADSFSYEFTSRSTDDDEIRWLEDVKLMFSLVSNKQPLIAKDEKGNQMVTTNLETIKQGDPLRMSVRFDRPVQISDPDSNCYVTADIYNDKGAILAKDVKLTLTQLKFDRTVDGESTHHHYAWDTLVFEGELPSVIDGVKIASLRNIKIVDGSENAETPTTDGIRSFLAEIKLLDKNINNIYISKDFRTPVPTVSINGTEGWSKSKSIDVSVGAEESSGRFTDYVTVYYQWSDNGEDTPKTYSSKLTFHYSKDGKDRETIIGTGSGEMYLYMKAVSAFGKSSVKKFGPFKFDNEAPKLTTAQVGVKGTLKEKEISIPFPPDSSEKSGFNEISLYYVKKNGEEVCLKTFTGDDFKTDPKTLTHTISHTDVEVGVAVDENGNTILERETVNFYWILTDKLGNSSGKTAEFSAVFDTYNYISEEIMLAFGPIDFSGTNQFVQKPEMLGEEEDRTYVYNYKDISGNTIVKQGNNTGDKPIYYSFGFEINGKELPEDKKEYYDIIISYNGEPLTSDKYSVIYDTVVTVRQDGNDVEISWRVLLRLHKEIESGRYDIRLVRSINGENATQQLSQLYTVFATANKNDSTASRNKIEGGTLLTNTVYQLSSEALNFYYKDASGVVQKGYYNGSKLPATFSTFEKAKEYVYYKELSDIYLVQLDAKSASLMSNGELGYLRADGEKVAPQAGQYWIRYKSQNWTPTSGESYWVYYYYGDSGILTEGALSVNLLNALNTVANRITGYGKTLVLTDTSLFLDSAMGDRLLDENGMPYLAPEQIHNVEEISTKTICGNDWSIEVAFAADKNIYKSVISIGTEGEADYREYPIIGNFDLPEDSMFQYMTYEQYNKGTESWKTLNLANGKSLFDMLGASGIYYIREFSVDGVAIYAVYIDKEEPDVTLYRTGDDGNLEEIPIDKNASFPITTKDLYIGSISENESDRLSYVSVYKVSNLALVGVYIASDLALEPVKLEDGNYYVVVSDRSGNHYTLTVKVSSTSFETKITKSDNRYIKITCNRRSDQILRYEVYLDGELLTSTYAEERTFTDAGLYKIYIQDIYGNEYIKEERFERNYPTVTWKYCGSDQKFHVYDENDTSATGFTSVKISDNQYKISTAVQTRFSFSGDYAYEFVGAVPKHTESFGTETNVTIEAGQSFTLKVYYKSHKNCYTMYSGVVDVTPPSVSVTAEEDVLRNGEYALFGDWAQNGKVGDVLALQELYYVLEETAKKAVSNGGVVSSDIIKINASDANDLSLVEVYLDGDLITKQDVKSGFSQVVVNKWGKYRVVAKDALGNVSEFTFTNGSPDYFDYFVDGAEKEQELHGHLNFKTVDGKRVYTKIDFGNKDFKLNFKNDADVFLSVGVSGGATEIYGFRISNGSIYSLTYKIVDKDGDKAVDLVKGTALLDINDKELKIGQEYPTSKTGAYSVYASVASDKTVSIRVKVPEDSSKSLSVSARIEGSSGSNISFVSAELSKKISNVTFKGGEVQTNDNVRVNDGFTVDESAFESERISSIRLYYSKLNDLDVNDLAGKMNIYSADKEYDDEGFYLMIVRNHYGNERVYKILISRNFGITSSVTFEDGNKLFYSKDYEGALYSNGEIVLDMLDEGVTFNVTLNGSAYTGFVQKKDGDITYLVFTEPGKYEVKLRDSCGNILIKHLEINKDTYTVSDDLLTGYNEKALKRDEGYTNQKLSIDKNVYLKSGIYYLAIQYGDTLNVLLDAFSEEAVSIDETALVNAIGFGGDGVYKLICRNRYGAIVTKDIHYRETPTLRLERTIRSKSESEVYALNYALSLGFWSNNTLSFITDAKTYVFTVNGNTTECPKNLVFENSGDFGSFEYDITYIDEYGFEYSFKAYLVRKNVEVNVPSEIGTTEIDGVLSTKKDISITFGENIYAIYTRNSGEEVAYQSGSVLKKDGIYRFTVMDYAGNATTITIKKDTAVEFSFVDSVSGNLIQNGSVVNSSKIGFRDLNKDGAFIEKVLHNGVIQTEFSGSKFTEDGKWELIICDKLGNRAYFSFFVVTHSQNGFSYTTPYEYRITEMWYDSGDGVKVSYMTFVNHADSTSSFNFTENGTYTVVMTSDVTGMTSTFEFTVNTNAPAVSLVGCGNGETTINDVTIAGYKIGDIIRIYQETKKGEKLVEEVKITSLSTKIPTITEGGKYRVVVESEAGVQTELFFVRKHVMNTAGSIFIMVIIAIAVVGLFTGLVYRNKSKTDD